MTIETFKSIESIAMVSPVTDSLNTFLIESKNGQSSRRSIFQMCVQKNWILTEMTPIETKLEDIFRELTT